MNSTFRTKLKNALKKADAEKAVDALDLAQIMEESRLVNNQVEKSNRQLGKRADLHQSHQIPKLLKLLEEVGFIRKFQKNWEVCQEKLGNFPGQSEPALRLDPGQSEPANSLKTISSSSNGVSADADPPKDSVPSSPACAGDAPFSERAVDPLRGGVSAGSAKSSGPSAALAADNPELYQFVGQPLLAYTPAAPGTYLRSMATSLAVLIAPKGSDGPVPRPEMDSPLGEIVVYPEDTYEDIWMRNGQYIQALREYIQFTCQEWGHVQEPISGYYIDRGSLLSATPLWKLLLSRGKGCVKLEDEYGEGLGRKNFNVARKYLTKRYEKGRGQRYLVADLFLSVLRDKLLDAGMEDAQKITPATYNGQETIRVNCVLKWMREQQEKYGLWNRLVNNGWMYTKYFSLTNYMEYCIHHWKQDPQEKTWTSFLQAMVPMEEDEEGENADSWGVGYLRLALNRASTVKKGEWEVPDLWERILDDWHNKGYAKEVSVLGKLYDKYRGERDELREIVADLPPRDQDEFADKMCVDERAELDKVNASLQMIRDGFERADEKIQEGELQPGQLIDFLQSSQTPTA
jgi:hypothetical protein